MDLGTDAGDVARRLERRQETAEVLTGLAVLLFLFFVLVISMTLAGPGPLPAGGELPAEVAALVGSATLAVLAGLRIPALDRRAETELTRLGVENWLPEDGRTDFEDDVTGLRSQGRRAVFVATVCAWVLAGCAALFGANGTGGASAETGTEALADVVAVADAQGVPGLWVEYRVDGVPRTVKLSQDSVDGHAVGQVVAVVYDPAHPQDVRLAGEAEASPSPVALLIVLMVIAVGVVLGQVLQALHRRRLDRAVRRTGWRRASVTVVRGAGARRRKVPDFEVRFRDGSSIALHGNERSRYTGVLTERPGRLAWIGGWGRDMVVLFPAGAVGERPLAIPAYAPGKRRS
ncbi:hypothetical protein [Amycolatopsis sp. cg9]|uniref:DUF3592 domain-containing protein n=1 Tax=Amycolatopsis sp. cg9 TaxID=3238801 RepID=UPI003525FFD3